MSDYPHEYGPSRVGHGEAQCIHCLGTNREIMVVGDLNHCEVRAAKSVRPRGEALADFLGALSPTGERIGKWLNTLNREQRERFIGAMHSATKFCWSCFDTCGGTCERDE